MTINILEKLEKVPSLRDVVLENMMEKDKALQEAIKLNLTVPFMKELMERQSGESNIVINVVGKRWSGKSEFALFCCYLLFKFCNTTFNPADNFPFKERKNHISRNKTQLLRMLKSAPENSAYINDEPVNYHGMGSKAEATFINNIVDSIRAKRVSIFDCASKIQDINFDYLVRMIKVDFEGGIAHSILYERDINGIMVPLGRLTTGRAPMSWIDSYKPEKLEEIDRIQTGEDEKIDEIILNSKKLLENMRWEECESRDERILLAREILKGNFTKGMLKQIVIKAEQIERELKKKGTDINDIFLENMDKYVNLVLNDKFWKSNTNKEQKRMTVIYDVNKKFHIRLSNRKADMIVARATQIDRERKKKEKKPTMDTFPLFR